jgi:hypothetical protein
MIMGNGIVRRIILVPVRAASNVITSAPNFMEIRLAILYLGLLYAYGRRRSHERRRHYDVISPRRVSFIMASWRRMILPPHYFEYKKYEFGVPTNGITYISNFVKICCMAERKIRKTNDIWQHTVLLERHDRQTDGQNRPIRHSSLTIEH